MLIDKHRFEVIVVEDSPVQLEHISSILTQNNYSVKCFTNAKDVIDYLNVFTPSLVITDVVMPDVSGFDLCKLIKSQEKTSQIPVILLTALSDPEDIITGLEVGADSFITKPFSSKFLLSRVEYCLVNSQMRKNTNADMGIEIVFGGKKYFINSTKTQILDLLISTYENTLEKNKELEHTVKELQKAQKDLIDAKELADTANRHKSEFLATMSHEIRTPMNVIIGISQILLDSDISDENKQHVSILKSSAESLLSILNDILDISKIESGVAEVEDISFNIKSLIEDLKNFFGIAANQKGLDIKTYISDDVSDFIISDYMKVKQILWNLLSNAIKFTEKGHIEVRLERAPYPSLSSEVVHLRFSISDTGIGIPAKKKSHIFESFTQIDSSTTRKYGGTGLGLAICKGLVNILGGSIDVDSEVGKGSTFYFTIPVKIPYTEPQKIPVCQEVEDVRDKKKKKLDILVVDDNELNQMIATRILTKVGHSVTTASDGTEAIDLLQKRTFDIVFMDINMPNMDGYETTKKIRSLGINAGEGPIPIIAMTAYATDGDKDRCLESGMDDYISKPIDSKALYRLLENYT
ncbi:MAG: response regulator [Thermodesulfovibrionales bacterium]